MSKLFKRFAKKDKYDEEYEKLEQSQNKPKYDFVETYTVVDPKRLLLNYALFSGCDMIPVACEGFQTAGSFVASLRLPKDVVYDFLNELKATPAKITNASHMRTISIVHLSQKQRIVILPDLKSQKGAFVWPIDFDKNGGLSWVFDITPEKNRAIVEQLKIHTR